MALTSALFDVASATGLPGFTLTGATAPAVGLIATGSVAQSDSTGVINALWGTPPSSADQAAQITLANSVGVQGVLLRATVNAGKVTAYVARHNGSQVAIQKLVDGALTTLRTSTRSRRAGQVLRATAVGPTLTLLLDGAPVATVTDTSITATGTTGVRAAEATGIQLARFFSGTTTEIAAAPSGALAAGTAPGQVTALTVPIATETTATLTWDAQTGAVDYVPQYRRADAASGAAWTDAPPTTVAVAVLTDLTMGTAYQARVAARNAAGSALPSVPASFSTRNVIQRTVSVPLLGEDDRLPETYMPGSYADLATRDQVAAAVAAGGGGGVTDAAVAFLIASGTQTRGALAAFTTGPAAPDDDTGWLTLKRVGNGDPIYSLAAQNMAPGKTAASSLYSPQIINARRYLGTAALDSYYMLLSTDHDTGAGGIYLATGPTPFGPWTGRGRVFVDTVSGKQSETAFAWWMPDEQLFYVLYQQEDVTGAVGVQTTCLATTPTLLAGSWTRVGIAIDIPANGAIPGNGHTGYAKVHREGQVLYSHHLMGGGSYPNFGLSTSDDGRTWWTDTRPLSYGADQNPDGRRIEWNSTCVVPWRGRRWWLGNTSNVVSGVAVKDTRIVAAPLSDDLRHLIGRPRPQLYPLAGLETTNYRGMHAQVFDGQLCVTYQCGDYFFAATAA